MKFFPPFPYEFPQFCITFYVFQWSFHMKIKNRKKNRKGKEGKGRKGRRENEEKIGAKDVDRLHSNNSILLYLTSP